MPHKLMAVAVLILLVCGAAHAYSISATYTPPASGNEGDEWSYSFTVESDDTAIKTFDVFIGHGISSDMLEIISPDNWGYTFHYSDTQASWIEWAFEGLGSVGQGTYSGFTIIDIADGTNLVDAAGPDATTPAGGRWYAQLRTANQNVDDPEYTQSNGHVPVLPEPSTLLIVALGLGAAAIVRKK